MQSLWQSAVTFQKGKTTPRTRQTTFLQHLQRKNHGLVILLMGAWIRQQNSNDSYNKTLNIFDILMFWTHKSSTSTTTTVHSCQVVVGRYFLSLIGYSKLHFLVNQNTALFSTFRPPLPPSNRHRHDISTFYYNLMVKTMKTIYFLTTYWFFALLLKGLLAVKVVDVKREEMVNNDTKGKL